MPTIPEIVDLYPIAQYKAQQAILKQGTRGSVSVSLPHKIRNIGDSVKRVYDADPTDTTLPITANALWTLCGIFGMQALVTQGTPGYVPTPTPPSGIEPIDYEIGASTIPFAEGDRSAILSDFIGYNIIFNRSNIPQSTVDQGGTYYSWDKDTGELTLFGPLPINGAAQLTEIFQITPV